MKLIKRLDVVWSENEQEDIAHHGDVIAGPGKKTVNKKGKVATGLSDRKFSRATAATMTLSGNTKIQFQTFQILILQMKSLVQRKLLKGYVHHQ